MYNDIILPVIKNTFSLLKGIGRNIELRLWRNGIVDWEDFIQAGQIGFIRRERKAFFDAKLSLAAGKLASGDSPYFALALRPGEHWRLFERFRGEAVCLDIESNGLPAGVGGCVTVVGLYDGFDYRAFVRGENLSAPALQRELSRYRYLITFFGSGFDMPFLRQSLGVEFGGAHFDLCFGARRLGLKGGLKKLEREFAIGRDGAVTGLDGYDAVKLWEEARRGSRAARELLVLYNKCDTVNLWEMSEILYGRLRAQTGIEEYLN
jgi:uncharacterized protein YprB with RNaseH-like and TPR domain